MSKGSEVVIHMDDWLRGHGRSVPLSNNGEILHWEHTPQAFSDDELKSLYREGIVLNRTFTAEEKAAMDAYTSPQWPMK